MQDTSIYCTLLWSIINGLYVSYPLGLNRLTNLERLPAWCTIMNVDAFTNACHSLLSIPIALKASYSELL